VGGVKFFFDNCLPPSLAHALKLLAAKDGHEIQHLRDQFPPATTDVEWINKLGADGEWVIVSGDLRISRSKHERAAWLQSHLTSFFLAKGWMNISFWEQAWKLIRWFPDIVKQAGMVKPGAGFEVPVKYNGQFKQINQF
jgi:hypothetical protein